MLMAVIERRSEFGLLSAVGFSGPQIAGRVLVESILTTIIGAAIGLLLGVIGAQLLVDALGARTFVSPQVSAWDLGRAYAPKSASGYGVRLLVELARSYI